MPPKAGQDDLEEAERLNASQCRFSDQDYVRFEDLLNHPDFRASSCGKRMETLMAPPAPPSDKVQDMLLQLEVSGHPLASEEPRLPWVKAACKHRDHLYSTVLCFRLDSDVELCFAFLFATQSPYKVHLLPLERDPPVLPLAPDAPQPVASVLSALPLHQWRVGERRYITDKDLTVDADTEPFVAPFAAWRSEGRVDSHSVLVPLSLFVSMEEPMAKPESHPKKDKDIKKSNVEDQLLEQYPFLRRYMKEPSERASKELESAKAKQLRLLARPLERRCRRRHMKRSSGCSKTSAKNGRSPTRVHKSTSRRQCREVPGQKRTWEWRLMPSRPTRRVTGPRSSAQCTVSPSKPPFPSASTQRRWPRV